MSGRMGTRPRVAVGVVVLAALLLIVPAACAALFFTSLRVRLLWGGLIGALASAAGILASAFWDLPTGPAVVAALGGVFALSTAAALARRDPGGSR